MSMTVFTMLNLHILCDCFHNSAIQCCNKTVSVQISKEFKITIKTKESQCQMSTVWSDLGMVRFIRSQQLTGVAPGSLEPSPVSPAFL